MKVMRLIRHQVGYDFRVFLRNPAARFFTVALPIIMLVLFISIFGNDRLDDTHITVATYYVPALMTVAIISSTFFSFAISFTEQRERGQLKRLRSTPLPPAVFILSRMCLSVALAFTMAAVLVLIGNLIWGVSIPTNTLPGCLIAIAAGAASFSALGIAATAMIPSADAAPPITNACTLPLYFISGIFIPESQLPDLVSKIGGVFPLKPLNDALQFAFDPQRTGAGIDSKHLLVLFAWGLGGLLIAAKKFRWAPKSD